MRWLLLMTFFLGSLAYAWCPDPAFCGRECWDPDGTHRPRAEGTPTVPTHIVLHHSGDGTVFSDGTNFQDIVRLYWKLHVEDNGWDDIGYNWLIDRHGQIYEGRPRGTQGAHFSCMNGGTIGICLIGDFRFEQPTQAALDALAHLVAWEASDRAIDVLKPSYHASSQLDLPGLCAHRDGNASTAPGSCVSGTICPGPNLYAQMDEIRMNSVEHCSGIAPIVYPNPTFGISHVGGDGIRNVEVFSSDGKAMDGAVDGLLIDLSGEARGLYIVRIVRQDGQTVVLKLIKQ